MYIILHYIYTLYTLLYYNILLHKRIEIEICVSSEDMYNKYNIFYQTLLNMMNSVNL